MPTGDEIDRDNMKRYAEDFVWANKLEFLNYMDRWVQRTDFRFPLDVKKLEEYSRMNRVDVDTRFKPIYQQIISLDIPEAKKKEMREKIDAEYILESDKVSQKDTAIGILQYLESNPVEMIKALNLALYDLMVQEGETDYDDYYDPEFEVLNWPVSTIPSLKYEDLGKLKSLSGWIGTIGSPHIQYLEVAYKCAACGHITHSPVKPQSCEECGYDKTKNLIFVPEESTGQQVQEIVLMENYDEMNPETTPGNLPCYVTGDNINKFTIGDRINVMGIVSIVKKKFDTYLSLNVLNIARKQEEIHLSAKDIEIITEIGKDPIDFIHKNLGRSVIGEEYEIIKESLAMAIAGGSESRKRSNIHMLLIGNPGIGKSELLYSGKEDSPKGYFVARTSGPGLTAAKATVLGTDVLVPGMMVLANGGVLMIDEIDKIKKDGLDAIHSAMEQGQFTYSMAGLRGTFFTNTTIIAAANPSGSHFDQSRTVLEQINMPESLLQRFDIVWAMYGQGHVDALKILRSTEEMDDPLIKKYFAYCSKLNPSVANVEQEIAEFFQEVREKSGDMSIVPRHLMAMKRLTQASAKLHLREEATLDDVREMEKVIMAYLRPFGFSINNMLVPVTLKDKIWKLIDMFKERKMWNKEELLNETKYSEQDLDRCLDVMKKEGTIYEPGNNRYKVA
ncbi:MAG: ATP-binding protein [Ferroplasma sp.]|uniref:ATP-binding protein n=1 Tax=Ferroplasma sp. TaxID=2591003 RepID=UPI002816888A|nr:ATP-binding protein [Ferroplasma sp.]WMT51218.1 MAG: ATP-binding protein [Ferroplasma sp.]WMT51261.1 MAG: ATP-binding protein [Ferroplasma sp.]